MLLGQRGGKHYVMYPDGQRSQLMLKSTAKDYAEIFGGKVARVPCRFSWQSVKDYFRAWWN